MIGQRSTGVRCVYAAVGSSQEQLQRTVDQLRAAGCLEYTTVVAATGDRCGWGGLGQAGGRDVALMWR